METGQWWNCCGNTWRCEAMCIVRDVYSGLPVEVVQWVSLTFYPFFICFLSHSGTYTLTSLNLVYEVLLFQCLYPVSTTRNGHNINFWSKMFHMVCCTISSPAGSQLSGSATSIFGGHEGLWVPGGARLIPGEIKPDENIDFHDINTFHRNIIFRVGQPMGTTFSCAFPKLQLISSSSSAPLQVHWGRG